MAARRPESPTHIGPYRVLRPMGSGGMAHVYAVEDPATGRNRAVKLLTRRGMAWTRFEREYRALARMDHPNIVRVFRFGVTDKRQPYLVMELLEGLPIQEWASGFGEVGDPERVEATVRALAGVADALEYLHRRGFIHRDLKSNNVLVLPDGTAKLLDFGATRGVGPDASSITRFGEFVGTYTYASPEQIDGDEQDARSDVYSLGVLAYRVLCGRPPFEADSILAITRMHFEQAPDPPHERVPSLPLPISGLVLEMLAKQPRERVQSAGEVADRLRWSNSTQVVLDQDEATNELTTSPSLVGRRQTLRAVQATLERARPGRMVLVIGAPGGGRHRIMKEARALASSAGFLLYRAELDDAGALDLTSLGNDTTPLPDPRTFLAALERHNRAAVLFCRDLHDASPEALESIKLIRQGVTHKGTPLLVFASLLSSEDNPAIRLAFMDASRISLRPLTVGEVGTLMASMLGEGSIPTQTVNHVAEATGGQPGFVRERWRPRGCSWPSRRREAGFAGEIDPREASRYPGHSGGKPPG